MIETNRLNIIPLTFGQLQKYVLNDNSLEQDLGLNLTERTISPDLAEALSDTILKNTADKSKNYLYTTLWSVILKSENKIVGDLCFMGEPDFFGQVELGYGTYKNFRGNGFMTEAVGALVAWASTQPTIKIILATTETQNIASVRVLEKNGFILSGETQNLIQWRRIC
jgi:RimJ/RimL family protein N-acetyltransferase